MPEEADVIEVYLVHRDGTLLSHRRLTRGEHHRARPGEFAVRERAEEELRRGEGERIEYKPFIRAGDKKQQDVIRTVVAFRNTFGGRIYIGVDDDGTPQGEKELRAIAKADEEQSIACMVRHVQKLIREHVKPDPDASVSAIAVFGGPVVVVDVRAGEDAPYSTSQQDVFIRRGATTRKPDPLTELPWVITRARERSERRHRQELSDALGASSYQKGDD